MNGSRISFDNRMRTARDFFLSRWDIFAAALAGLVTGLLLVVVGPTLTLALLFAIAFLFILFKTPEVVILLLLLFTSGLLSPSWNPRLNLGVGHFGLSDLLLIALLGVTVLRLLAERDFRLRPTPLYVPLGLLCLAVFGGMLTAVLEHGVRFSDTTYQARIMLYYALFFVVANIVRTRRQARWLVYGVFAIGIVTAVLIVAQIVFGFSVPLVFAVYFKPDLLVRAYHPGFFAVLMTLMTLVCLLAVERPLRQVAWTWLAVFVLAASIMVSLGRNIVVSTLLAMIVLFLLLRPPQQTRLARSMAIILTIAILTFSILQLVAPSMPLLAYPNALLERFVHLFVTDPLSPDETILWRVKETGFAWEQIVQSPITGIGFQTAYRSDFFKGDVLQNYIHNGYLWVWLKTGLLGLIPFLWFFLAFLTRGFRQWRHVRDETLRAASLGFTLVIFAMMFSNFVAPLLVADFNIAFFAAGMGFVEAVSALERESE